MKRFIAAMLLGLIATPANAITLQDLQYEDCMVSIDLPDRPRIQARLDRRCPGGLWVVGFDGAEIVCIGNDETTTVGLNPPVCPIQ
jgi:hypothetical protein